MERYSSSRVSLPGVSEFAIAAAIRPLLSFNRSTRRWVFWCGLPECFEPLSRQMRRYSITFRRYRWHFTVFIDNTIVPTASKYQSAGAGCHQQQQSTDNGQVRKRYSAAIESLSTLHAPETVHFECCHHGKCGQQQCRFARIDAD